MSWPRDGILGGRRISIMAEPKIMISKSAHEFAKRKAHEKGLDTPDAYVDWLVERDRRREERIEALLIEGLDSGPAEPFTPEDWAAMRREAMDLLKARAGTT